MTVMKSPIIAVASVMLMLFVSNTPAAFAPAFLLSARAEWGLSADRQRANHSISRGSDASNQSYHLSLSGRLSRAIHFSSSASLSKITQTFRHQQTRNYSMKNDALSNSLLLFPERTFSLALRHRMSSTRNVNPLSYSLVGGTLKGILFPGGVRFSLDGERLKQSYSDANLSSRSETDLATFKVERTGKRWSFESAQIWNQVRTGVKLQESSTSQARSTYRFSDRRQLTGQFSLQESSNNKNVSGGVEFSNNFSAKRGYGLGMTHVYNRFSNVMDTTRWYRSTGVTATGFSRQEIGRRLEHSVSLSSRVGIDKQNYSQGVRDLKLWYVTLGNSLRQNKSNWILEVGYSSTIENSRLEESSIGSRHRFSFSGQTERDKWRLRNGYSLTLDRSDLYQTSHSLDSELKRQFSRYVSWELTAHVQFLDNGPSQISRSGENRDFVLRSGVNWQREKVSAIISHQIQATSSNQYHTIRNLTTANCSWRFANGLRVESQGSLSFESASESRIAQLQASGSYSIGLVDVTVNARYQHSRFFTATSSTGFVGFTVSRSLQKAF